MAVPANNASIGIKANGSAHQMPKQISTLEERTNRKLLELVRDNFDTQYIAQAPSLSAFRGAVSAHGGTKVDATLLADFRNNVPLSNSDCYKPFIDKFNTQPCKKEDVENLLAPGLPDCFLLSSGTTSATPKLLARYSKPGAVIPPCPFFDKNSKTPLAAIVYCGSAGVREVTDASGQVICKIPIYVATGRMIRGFFGWAADDDKDRLSMPLPYYAVPWAATTIENFPSLLKIHGLFFLAQRDLDRFYVALAMLFVDLICYIDKEWDMFVSSIRDGIIPDLEGIDDVREHLQAQFHANPERAAELFEVGPPSSVEGWAPRVWPNLRLICTVCTGPWITVLPKLRSIVGPNTFIRTPGYGASESTIGFAPDVHKSDEFVLPDDKVIEFLDVSGPDAIENIRQPWEVEVGKPYEVILTTISGLWRYQLGDIVTIAGFHPRMDSPIFRYVGRKSVALHLPYAQIADFQLFEAVRVASSEDAIVVQEFTTIVDDRASPPTVGYLVELSKPPGPNAHLVPQRLFDTFLTTDVKHQLEGGHFRAPTVRVVRPGTFLEYRDEKGKALKSNLGQYKIPAVLTNPTIKEWILERVIKEL